MRAVLVSIAILASGLAAAACAGGGGGGTTPTPTPTGTPVAPTVIYDGALGGIVPGWSASDPRPLVLFATQNGGASYFTSAHIETNGVVDGIVVDHVKVWGWSGGAGAPVLLYHGPLAGGHVPGWDEASPRALLVYSRQSGSSGGYASASGQILADGSMTGIVADEIWVWGFASDPALRYDGVLSSAAVPSFDPSAPDPTLFADQYQGGWYDPPLAVQVLDDGSVTNLAGDRMRIWGF